MSSYEIDISSSISLFGSNYLAVSRITPNTKQGVKVAFHSFNAFVNMLGDETRDIVNIPFANVTSTAGVQLIAIKSQFDGYIKFLDTAGNVMIGDSTNGITLVPGQSLLGVRDDNNISIPLNFAIPTSGTLDKIQITKFYNRIGGTCEVEIYYNVAES